jgi:hypothetical protein
VDTTLAAMQGDYRAAGAAGLTTAVLMVATVIGAGEGADALTAETAARAAAATEVGGARGGALPRPEAKYLGSGKHGVRWKEGPATAKSLGKPQGQWGSKADLDYAAEKAGSLKPGEGQWFDLPEGHSSVVHMPDGTSVPANRFWVRNNGTGTFHGYPAE